MVLRGTGRVLTLVCGVLLALPPGWCCAAIAGQCCGPTLPSAPATSKCCTGKTCAGQTCSSGCLTELTHEHSATLPKPNCPCDASCCERPPADLPKVERPALDLGTVGVLVPFANAADHPVVAILVNVPPRSAFPPLHVLHCVWLC